MRSFLLVFLLFSTPAAADPFEFFHQCSSNSLVQNARHLHALNNCPSDGACVPDNLTTEMMVAADRECVTTQFWICNQRAEPSGCLTDFATAIHEARFAIFEELSAERMARVARSEEYGALGTRLLDRAKELRRQDLHLICTLPEDDVSVTSNFDRDSRCKQRSAMKFWLDARHLERIFLEVEYRANEWMTTPK
jgi:hypothetical protein